jgi:hypothetical protein
LNANAHAHLFIKWFLSFGIFAINSSAFATVPETAIPSALSVCQESIELSIANTANQIRFKSVCENINPLAACNSTQGRAIAHIDSLSDDKRGKRILVFGLIHGDEPLAAQLALEWNDRLKSIPHRNSWRIIPILNPDGLRLKTRMNAHGVDLNRNFPTSDWSKEANSFWQKQAKADPRRFPGENAASEAETKCAIAQIEDFKPDFIVSIHTPYKVLDFDGPKIHFPAYKDLPWRALGNFPGSLGRYMWKDFGVPVLTIELGENMVDASRLQDILGTFAINASEQAQPKKYQSSSSR